MLMLPARQTGIHLGREDLHDSMERSGLGVWFAQVRARDTAASDHDVRALDLVYAVRGGEDVAPVDDRTAALQEGHSIDDPHHRDHIAVVVFGARHSIDDAALAVVIAMSYLVLVWVFGYNCRMSI